jgi:hypothetical protein
MRYCLILLLLLAACSPAPTPESTRPPLPATLAPSEAVASATPSATFAAETTSEPTLTPMAVVDLPAIKLLTGAAESCVNAEDYGKLLAFNVRYYEVTTANRLHFRLEDEAGTILSEDDASGENKDGEEGWGFYPLAYEVPENSILTFTLEVYESMEADAILTSTTSISFNCTTGETIEASFERL